MTSCEDGRPGSISTERKLAMGHLSRRSLLLSSLGVAVLAPAQSHAQTFPSRPVTMVVPYAAGGPTDVASRVIASQMQASLGVNVIIENKPGASTILGAQYVAGAAPDGHTIFMVTTTTLCTNPHLYKKLPYKVEDFAPIAMAVKVPLGLAVRSSLPVASIAEFRDYAQARAGKMNYGSGLQQVHRAGDEGPLAGSTHGFNHVRAANDFIALKPDWLALHREEVVKRDYHYLNYVRVRQLHWLQLSLAH